MATPAERRSDNFVFCATEEELKTIWTGSGSFSGSFFVCFQTLVRTELNIFRGQFRSADVPPKEYDLIKPQVPHIFCCLRFVRSSSHPSAWTKAEAIQNSSQNRLSRTSLTIRETSSWILREPEM